MNRLRCERGFTMVDLINTMLLVAVIMGMTALLGRRAVARYQLNAAVRMLSIDMARVKTRAIQTNALSAVARESDKYYRASGSPRELPSLVRFDETSADSVAFNGLGAVADGLTHRFILVTSFGYSKEVFVYAAGGQEIRKL